MLRRRLIYGAVLISAILFQIFFTAYLGTFVLALAILFPILSLLLSLPGLLGCRLLVAPTTGQIQRGGECQWLITVENRVGLPFSRLTFRLQEENLLTGKRAALRRAVSGGSKGLCLRESADCDHCGLVVCTLTSAKICDLMGLFSFRLPNPAPGEVLVLPKPAEPAPGSKSDPAFSQGPHGGGGLKPRPGGGPGEDYDLRPYRPGDPMRTVHWKLSSKWDELVVRETLEPRQIALVLTFDHFGPPERLDLTFDLLCALSRWLLSQERPHFIQWADPVTGLAESHAVDCERALTACLTNAFSTPAPLTGRSILDAPVRVEGADGPVRRFHVVPDGLFADTSAKDGAPEGGGVG